MQENLKIIINTILAPQTTNTILIVKKRQIAKKLNRVKIVPFCIILNTIRLNIIIRSCTFSLTRSTICDTASRMISTSSKMSTELP